MKALLYCTKNKKWYSVGHLRFATDDLFYSPHYQKYKYGCSVELMAYDEPYTKDNFLNGKVVAMCDIEVKKIECGCVPYRKSNNLGYEHFVDNGVYKVEWKENINLIDKDKKYNDPTIYKDEAVVFENADGKYIELFKNDDLQKMCLSPQELLDYIKLGKDGYALNITNLKIFEKRKYLADYFNSQKEPITRSPQNMMYAYDEEGNQYALISIRPEWLCKILNGEKTIEVRKTILKGMKNNDK